MDIRAHAKAIRLKREELDSQYPNRYLYCTTMDNRLKGIKGGGVSEVTTLVAATGLVEGTLRISTEVEIDAYQKRNQAVRELILRGEQARQPKPLAVTVDRR